MTLADDSFAQAPLTQARATQPSATHLSAADASATDTSFSVVFASALRGVPCHVVALEGGLDGERSYLPVGNWTREADDVDQNFLSHCVGATIDIGCGPGRLSAALADLGHVVLGIDVVGEAVDQTRDRGVSALRRDVFGEIPGEGRWRTALLADGNVGIGGDPMALLRRARQLLDPRGRVVVELAAPGVASSTTWAAIECGPLRSRPFRWSVVGVDDITALAIEVGLAVHVVEQHRDRWVAVLQEAL